MFFDNKPCQVCGSEVELRARTSVDDANGADHDTDHQPDATVDVRVCTNPRCPSHESPDGPLRV